MNVVDSSGWMEYFTEGKNANFFMPPVQDLENLTRPHDLHLRGFQTACTGCMAKMVHLQAVGVMSYGSSG